MLQGAVAEPCDRCGHAFGHRPGYQFQTPTGLAGQWAPALAWKLPMTYAVPFIVATLGALGTGKVPSRP